MQAITPLATAFATAALLAVALGGATPPALAQTPPVPPQPPAAGSAGMGMPQLIEHLRALGYSDIREIERKGDKLYEVEARDPSGQRVELVVDARSGEILRSKPER